MQGEANRTDSTLDRAGRGQEEQDKCGERIFKDLMERLLSCRYSVLDLSLREA